jgi:integrase
MSNRVVGLPSISTESIELPSLVTSINGAQFDPREDIWSYRDSSSNVSLNFENLWAEADWVLSAKRVLIWYVENKSPYHVTNLFSYLVGFLKRIAPDVYKVSVITSKDILNFQAGLKERDSYYLGTLSGLFCKWHELNIPGVSDDAVALLKQLRIKGNIKGEAVLTMNPEKGPFTEIEFEAIQVALNEAFAAQEISLGDFLLVILLMALGQRPIQYAAIKVCDVIVGIAKERTPVFTLRVPRAKQRGKMSRVEFKDRVLNPQIGKKLVQYANEVKAAFSDILEDPSQAPLFPAKRSRKNEPPGFEYHRTAQSLADTLERVLQRLNVTSERTGQRLHITATRFRHTVGTRAACEGHGELVIAELLDHSDTQNVGIYVEAVPAIAERIDRAMAMHLAPLAQAFSGTIISAESQATRAGDPSSRICDPRFDSSMKPMGNCGQYGYCGLLAPIACYTCRSFQPWLDGPHEAVLEYLLAERERLMRGSDARIATINDRTFLAVAEVIRQCEEIRKKAGAGDA